MKKILLSLSPEMLAAIDKARGKQPRGPWIEQRLARLPIVKRAAKNLAIELPEREDDGRGKWDR